MSMRFQGESGWEDTPYTVLARLCAVTASGSASPVETEGTLLNKTDVTSIACKIYDADGVVIITSVPSVVSSVYFLLETQR